ncbi:MAG TPA: transglycosylase SLT domain-containing protein [Thermoanaerobaculia bacterium]|jgi:membrane-bound lytic murein transglycosylase F|nr:transglycosylase SLT domain-containing protein [Thermoanaerobaculia bacterium]
MDVDGAVRRVAGAMMFVVAVGCGREPAAPASAAKPAPPPKPAASASPLPKPVEAPSPVAPTTPPIARDLDAIRAEKTLRVLFTFNSTGYFVFRGDTMGYEYELLSRFAHDSGLHLVPVVVRDSAALIERLNKGDGDVVAAQLVAPGNEKEILATDGLYETAAVVVQRGGGSPASGHTAATTTALEREQQETGETPVTVHARLVGTPRELAGQNVHLSRRSPYRGTLLELNDSLSDDVHVVEVDESADKLIQRLSEGEIGYTVAAENVAKLKATEYSNLVIQPQLGPPKQVVWAVRRNAPQLHDALNAWLKTQRKLMAVLYRKYFLDRRGFAQRAASRYLTAETGTLSPFDDSFREYARIPGWDWRLVASQAYQESRFNPNAKSWAGAVGLMQIMPRTARELRVNPHDPRQSIEGACRYLWKFDHHFDDVSREDDRTRLVLASYNVGLGHVEDARRLAKKYGDDPSKWEDVAYWLIRKSKRSVYNDPVVKYGFARGTEPVDYVERIMDRFGHYQQFVEAEPAVDE